MEKNIGRSGKTHSLSDERFMTPCFTAITSERERSKETDDVQRDIKSETCERDLLITLLKG